MPIAVDRPPLHSYDVAVRWLLKQKAGQRNVKATIAKMVNGAIL